MILSLKPLFWLGLPAQVSIINKSARVWLTSTKRGPDMPAPYVLSPSVIPSPLAKYSRKEGSPQKSPSPTILFPMISDTADKVVWCPVCSHLVLSSQTQIHQVCLTFLWKPSGNINTKTFELIEEAFHVETSTPFSFKQMLFPRLLLPQWPAPVLTCVVMFRRLNPWQKLRFLGDFMFFPHTPFLLALPLSLFCPCSSSSPELLLARFSWSLPYFGKKSNTEDAGFRYKVVPHSILHRWFNVQLLF